MTWERIRKFWAYMFATWFHIGSMPVAPGTWGSLFALPLAYFCIYWGGGWWLLTAAVLVFLLGVWATRIVLTYTTNKDPSFVVIDEVVGQMLVFLGVGNILHLHLDRWYFLAGFALFRFFDIVKIWPASYYDQHVHSAFGVMMDDVVAGLYGAICLASLVLFFGF